MTPAAPIPPPFEGMEGRRLSFDPPILKVPTNEWTYRRATWSDILVRNTATGDDLWIPRRFLGASLDLAHPVLLINLVEKLECRDGTAWPHRKRVIEMPLPIPSDNPAPRVERSGPAPVIGIRLESRTESRASRFVGSAVALGVLGCLAVVGYSLQGGNPRPGAIATSLDQTYLVLNASDRYANVVRALGDPDSDRWVTTPQGKRLRLLEYNARGIRAVLFAASATDEVYAGTVDADGRVLQSVMLSSGETSLPLLRELAYF